MKVVYSVQVSLGKGFGYTAQQQVEALSNDLILHKLIIPETVGEFSDDFEFDKKASKLLSKVSIREEELKELKELKKLETLKIPITDLVGDVFIGWGNACLEQLKEARSLGIKTVVNRASTYIEYQDKILGKEGMKLDPESVRRQIEEYELADHILVPCEFVKNTFPEALKHKIKVIPFGVDSDKFTGDYSIKSKKFTVLYCGQNVRRKGLKYLMQAWLDLNLDNAELKILGDNPFNVEFTNITFTEYVENIIKEYQQASVFCLPSLEEGMALCILESLSCGTPVIITNHCGYNDILTKESKGYREYLEGDIIDIRDIQALAGRISWYHKHRDKCLKKGKAARKLAEKYTWSKFQSKFVKFIKSI